MIFKFFGRKKDEKKSNQTKSLRLEEDLNKLLSDLENGDMKYLVKQMGNDNIYSELLHKKRKYEISSTDDISWYAYRQSEKLSSARDKNELLQILLDKEFASFKKYIYTCLANICSNNNDRELFNFLVDKVLYEDDDSITTSVLSRFGEVKKDETFNIEPIKKLVVSGTYDVSHAAIKALSNSNDSEVETLLLDEFKITDRHMQGMICGPLSTVGTLKSIPVLKETYKKQETVFFVGQLMMQYIELK
ncbi:MAG: HEAT repeat domain-containing protein [Chitinophagaceae bacterium]